MLLLSSYLPLDCNLLSSFAFCLSPFFSPPWHIWITYHFPDCAPKKVKHSPPFSFLTDVKARRLPVVAEIDPGQTRERKSSRILLCSVHRLIWPCAVWMKQYSYKILDCTRIPVLFFFFPEHVKLIWIFLTRDTLHSKVIFICRSFNYMCQVILSQPFISFLFLLSNWPTCINAGLHKLALKCLFIPPRLLFLITHVQFDTIFSDVRNHLSSIRLWNF